MRRIERKGLAILPLLAGAHIGIAQCTGDLNGDNGVDLQDLLTLLVHYGNECTDAPDAFPTLHISEIHYNPHSSQGNDSDWEFLELYNPSSQGVALAGWKLSEAITFSFDPEDSIPAFGFFTVARNLDTLMTVLPSGAASGQWNSGEGLNNTGETIELRSPDNQVVQSIPYEDDDGWVAQPDGQGPSLEWMDTGLDNAAADAWTFSLVLGGTPGAPNSMWGLSDPE